MVGAVIFGGSSLAVTISGPRGIPDGAAGTSTGGRATQICGDGCGGSVWPVTISGFGGTAMTGCGCCTKICAGCCGKGGAATIEGFGGSPAGRAAAGAVG